MDGYLREHGLDPRWHQPGDLGELDREICKGRVSAVVFVRWPDLLEGIWNGEVSFEKWLKRGAEVRFIESPGQGPADYLACVSRAWVAHKRIRHRRQAISGIVLSAIALASASVVTFLAR